MNKSGKWKKSVETSPAATSAEADGLRLSRELVDAADRKELVLFASHTEDVSARTIRQAVNLCHRLDCGLALLLVHPAGNRPGRSTLPAELYQPIDVPLKIHFFGGSLPDGVREFMARHRRVISVALKDNGSENQAGRRPGKRRRQSWWQSLSCPVVLLSAAQEA
ncbi:MAG: hypothetical protein P8Y63_03980 [Deltaproteobacteria bacterium]